MAEAGLYETTDDIAESPDGEQYWAAKTAEDLHEELLERVDTYYHDYESNPFSTAISRNWAYYHGLFKGFEEFNILGGAIQRIGPRGERSFMGANHFRNLLQHLYILTIRDRPNPQSRANSPDNEALIDAMTVNGVLEEYLEEKRIEQYLTRSVEHCIVLTRGFVSLEWDPDAGEEKTGDMDTGRIVKTGDPLVRNPTILDVIRDTEVKSRQENQWYIVRDWPNKWDLAARHPELRQEILSQAEEPPDARWGMFHDLKKSDRIARYTFWHERTPALQMGRRVEFIRNTLLTNDAMPEEHPRIPLFEISPNEVLLTTEGYSPGFDLQGPQEALNMAISNVLTNLDTFGIQNIFSPTGNNLSVGQLSGGLRFIQGKVAPTPLQLTANPQDAYKFMELIVQYMELLSGVNSVTRGQPEASLKSGKALSLIEAKAIQFASELLKAYYHLIEDFCTALVRMLARRIGEDTRVSRIAGRFNQNLKKHYSGATLAKVDRVRVEAGNPMLKTLAGKMEIGETFVKNGYIKAPEELMTLWTTGRWEPMFQADMATMALVNSEKDALLDGLFAPVLKSDYHSLHIREQLALLNTPAIRLDQAKAANILGHVLVHVAFLYLPDVRDLQMAQGYQVPPLSPVIPPGLLDQIPPEYQGSLSPLDQMFLQQPMAGPGMAPGAPPQQNGGSAPPPPPGPAPAAPEEAPEPAESRF